MDEHFKHQFAALFKALREITKDIENLQREVENHSRSLQERRSEERQAQ